MANITIKELKKAVSVPNKDKVLTKEFKGLEIEITQYMPISDKIAIAESILASAIDRDSDLFVVDGNFIDIAFKVLLVDKYTNIRVPKAGVDAYDLLCESGVYDFVVENIPQSELTDLQIALNNVIDMKRDIYEQSNNIVNVVKKLFNNLVNNLPTEDKMNEILEGAKKELAQFEPDKLQYVQDFMKANRGESIG